MALAPVKIVHRFPKDSKEADVRGFADDKRQDSDVTNVEVKRDANTQEWMVEVTRSAT